MKILCEIEELLVNEREIFALDACTKSMQNRIIFILEYAPIATFYSKIIMKLVSVKFGIN